jgi:hypothetical protein
MTARYSLKFLALTLFAAAGCGGGRFETREGGAGPLVAYARASSDVPASEPERGLIVKVDPVRPGTLADPSRMMELRLSMERQISLQVKDVPEGRYRSLVRPRLESALLAAGLTEADVAYILHGVDYHRSL